MIRHRRRRKVDALKKALELRIRQDAVASGIHVQINHLASTLVARHVPPRECLIDPAEGEQRSGPRISRKIAAAFADVLVRLLDRFSVTVRALGRPTA